MDVCVRFVVKVCRKYFSSRKKHSGILLTTLSHICYRMKRSLPQTESFLSAGTGY